MPSASNERSPSLVIAASMLATVSTVFPGFLIGALSVQVSDEFQVSKGTYGWGLGAFFLAAAFGSVRLGRIAQKVGPRRQLTAALGGTAVVQVVLALFADRFLFIVLCLAVAGLLNAGSQTAINLALTQANLPRLGLAIAFKQSGMPGASMIAGLAVPAIALTVGWRWAYALGAVLAVIALPVVRRAVAPHPITRGGSRLEPVSSRPALWRAAGAGLFLAFGAGSLNAWIVASGVDAGMSEGTAGLMLSLGAVTGIGLRLLTGSRVDAMDRSVFRVSALILLVGASGLLLLSLRTPAIHVLATVLAFGGGWIWPVMVNYGIVGTNAEAASAATGVTQTGVFTGVFSAPLITGFIIDWWGYGVMWSVVAVAMLIGAAILVSVADEFDYGRP